MKWIMLLIMLSVSVIGNACYRNLILRIAVEEQVPPYFALAIALTENSTLNPLAVSPPNRNGTVDRGLMQLNENYFYSMNVWCGETNARTAIRHIRWLMSVAQGNTFWAVAAMYNAGAAWFKGLRPLPYAAARYADRVMLRWAQLEPANVLVVVNE